MTSINYPYKIREILTIAVHFEVSSNETIIVSTSITVNWHLNWRGVKRLQINSRN